MYDPVPKLLINLLCEIKLVHYKYEAMILQTLKLEWMTRISDNSVAISDIKFYANRYSLKNVIIRYISHSEKK